MKGKAEVLEVLGKMLKEELGAVSQYVLHSEICESWGYARLHAQIKKNAIDEMKHAEKLIERMLFLEGAPNMIDLPRLTIGKDVKQQLENDLGLERSAVAGYNAAIAVCQKGDDHGSAQLLRAILLDEEGHVDWWEAQLELIAQMGLPTYLSQQIHG